MSTPAPASQRARILNWLTPIAFVVAVILLSAVVARAVALATVQAALAQATVLPSGAANNTAPAQAADLSQMTIRSANRLGASTAPITIVEFSDFKCIFCAKAARETISQLRDRYVGEGKISLVYLHAAFLGDESTWAAQAAECAADQGQFWEYHDLLFSDRSGEQGGFTKEKLIALAGQLPLDLSRFASCLHNDETLARVQQDVVAAQAAGVRGTPTFFINGKPLIGAQPLAKFEEMIAAQLEV